MGEPYGSGTPGFGVASAATVVFVALLVWAAVWVSRHERPLARLWALGSDAAVIGGRVLTWARERIRARGWAWARLPADEVAAVALLLGLAAVVAVAVGFTEVLDDVLEGDGISGIDRPVAGWLAAHRDLWLTTALRAVTIGGDPRFLAALAFPISLVAGWRCRSWRPVALALTAGAGIALMLFTAKALVGRERPPLPYAAVAADGYSFPSGHATGTAAILVVAAWMVTRWLVSPWVGRVIVWSVAIGSALVIGYSRIYLGVHYVSDVLAGWLLGLAWAGVVMLVGSWWTDVRRRAPSG
ncbi:phosphatidic acid phosphatase [Mycobacterium alsense]|uniref:Phosphatase PAP2 family protein n=1 Tax=Mycobacterium alsense TaxID=324058 RepID=A0AA42BW37_9MYCO|nr:phosphatase PAP2 family protein [Mycobacterium alsense]MCV7377246.1 phosphatase PAP2 family protein [Mycobacterium alsense]OQZ88673.1 phosphatidic acid phosphatase [Mycobacterium alsense]